MPRAFTNNTPDDVLESFRRMMSAEEIGPEQAVEPNRSDANVETFPPRRRGAELATPLPAAAPTGPVAQPPRSTPEREVGHFVDRIASHISSSGRSEGTKSDPKTNRPPPMVLTSPIAKGTTAEPPVSDAVKSAPKRPTAEPKLCRLLLTPDFQVRGPERARLPHPVAPLAKDDYVEDSDLSQEADADLEMTPAAAALRETVGQAVRTALRAEVSALANPPDATAPSAEPPEAERAVQTPLVDQDGYLDAETLRQLIAGIVRDELRGELGADMSRRVRKLVRLEINRTLQIRALD